jgi:DNA-binding HxlR family transcriptional regulator
MRANYSCPVRATIDTLSGKWKVQVVWRLSFGPLRFAELRDLLGGVSEKVLTAQLRELEKDGVVNRTVVRSSPPKVTYSLSNSGQTLIPLLEGLCEWGSKQFGIKPNLPRKPQAVKVASS